jgi:F-type H+-transporting ATPase subunit b
MQFAHTLLAEEAVPADTTHTAGEAAPTTTHTSTETASTEGGSGGLGAIGLDGRALAFQVINFVILFFILKKVAYKPILKMLEARRAKIEEGVRLAEEAQTAVAEAEATKAKLLAEARQEADKIVAASRAEATEILQSVEAKATARAEQIVNDATERVEREAASVRTAMRKELGGLVASATEALIDEKLDGPKDAALIEKALAKAERLRG